MADNEQEIAYEPDFYRMDSLINDFKPTEISGDTAKNPRKL